MILMPLLPLLTIDTAFTLYMGKIIGSASDPKLFPKPALLHELTYKLLSKAERNFVEKRVVDGVWDDVPAGKGSIWNLQQNLDIADFCTQNMDKIKMPNKNVLAYAYQAVIDSRHPTKNNHKRLVETHIVPALLEGDHIDNYPSAVLQWVDKRLHYIISPLLKYLKEQGVPCPSAVDFTVADWEELIDAQFDTLEAKKEIPTAEDGGEIQAFSMMDAWTAETALMEAGGDEHISLFTNDFTGTYYLPDDENVEVAQQIQRILKGYWDLFGTCKSEADANNARRTLLLEVQMGIKDFVDIQKNANTGAGIVILD